MCGVCVRGCVGVWVCVCVYVCCVCAWVCGCVGVLCVCVCVYIYMCERERECVCVCVCVYVWMVPIYVCPGGLGYTRHVCLLAIHFGWMVELLIRNHNMTHPPAYFVIASDWQQCVCVCVCSHIRVMIRVRVRVRVKVRVRVRVRVLWCCDTVADPPLFCYISCLNSVGVFVVAW